MATELEIIRATKAWEETTTREASGERKISRALANYEWIGSAQGESTLDYSMLYLSNSIVRFVGHELVQAKIGERAGSFVLRHEGMFENGAVSIEVQIVRGSGTGGLSNILGRGRIEADANDPMKARLSLQVDLG